jgi:class 3 adenylate cyclase
MSGRPVWAWLVGGAALLVAGFGWLSPHALAEPGLTALHVVTFVIVLTAAWIGLGVPTQRSNGGLMLLFALALSSDALLNRNVGPSYFFANLLDPADDLLVLLLLLRWPRSRLQTRAQVWVVRVAFSVYPLLILANLLAWDPAWWANSEVWWGVSSDVWWPTLTHIPAVFNVLYDSWLSVGLALGTAYVVLLAIRLRSASRPERRELIPVAVAALALVVANVIPAIYSLAGEVAPAGLFLAQAIGYGCVPLTFLVAMLIRRIQRAAAVESLLRPAQLTSPESVRQTLARAFGDAGLNLALHSAEHGGYVDVYGAPAPDTPAGRFGIHVLGADGAALARIDVRASLADRPELTASVVQAAALALEHARLQAELRVQLREIDESRLLLEQARFEGEQLSRLLPGGLAEKLRQDPGAVDRTDRLTVTVLMSDIRGYSGVAERTQPGVLARQLNEHRAAMNAAILAEGGTVMQYVGDAVMAVFGAPFPQHDHARRAVLAASQMHRRQDGVNTQWAALAWEPFGLGIGISTGEVAAALLGSDERAEYTLVGDTVNLAQRLESAARPAGVTVASAATIQAAGDSAQAFVALPPLSVKGRVALVAAFATKAFDREPLEQSHG